MGSSAPEPANQPEQPIIQLLSTESPIFPARSAHTLQQLIWQRTLFKNLVTKHVHISMQSMTCIGLALANDFM